MPTLYDPPWTPFQRAEPIPKSEAEIAALAAGCNVEVGHLRRIMEDDMADAQVWKNSIYQVMTKPARSGRGWPAMILLSIKRIDKQAVHDWRDFQRIKNELVGPEHEAVELYPAERRLVDTANQYYLWAMARPGIAFPFGFFERMTREPHPSDAISGARQRPRQPH